MTTNPQTKVSRTDGSEMAACDSKVGQAASVDGWKKTDGTVRAALSPGRLYSLPFP